MGAIVATKANWVEGAATDIDLGGTSLGPTTQDGVVIEVTNNQQYRKCDQFKGVITSKLLDRDIHVKMTLKESTMANLVVALNLASSALSGSSLTIDDSEATDAQLVIKGVAPGTSKVRTMIFDQVKSVGNSSIVIADQKEQDLAMDFLVMRSSANSRYGIWGDA